MTPIRQKRIRDLLRTRPNGMTANELSEIMGLHVSNIRTALRAMPDTYVDRWSLGGRGQFEKVWIAVPVPADCPHPRDRTKWGTYTKPIKTQWVTV